MKKIISVLLIVSLVLLFPSCAMQSSKEQQEEKNITVQNTQLKNICDLATTECYYHNVAKYAEDDATGSLWWKKDRKFWIEYTGIVKIGIDTSKLHIERQENKIIITLPHAEVLSCQVDPKTLTENSFVVDSHSAKVEAEHQTMAFKEAQEKMRQSAANNSTLMDMASQRAMELLEKYITNIGNCAGVQYEVEFITDAEASTSQT